MLIKVTGDDERDSDKWIDMPHYPLLYEINTRCWLNELSKENGDKIELGNIPEEQFLHWQELGFTHIWLMGIWATGARGRAHSLNQPTLLRTYTEVLPDWKKEDISGSPYAVADYRVSSDFGGASGLQQFREKLHHRGLKLILDFVPNHLGLDHSWISDQPGLFVESPEGSAHGFYRKTPMGRRWFAHGKDPYFPPWTDTIQLEYRRAETRAAMIEVLHSVSRLCDGVRCDMAMLLLNDVFEKTWETIPSPGVGIRSEFWSQAIERIKEAYPNFLFLAEAYWGLEERLQDLGFDYTYDKGFYDHLMARNHGLAQRHLLEAPSRHLHSSVHFLENHDEPRVATRLAPSEHRAAALAALGLPGMRLLHEGQLTGARLQTCIHLGRRAIEEAQPEVAICYRQILDVLQKTSVGRGKAELLRPSAAWDGNPTCENFIVVQWQESAGSFRFDLVVVNLASHRSQCYVRLHIDGLAEHRWQMTDLLGDEIHVRPGCSLQQRGLYLDLAAHGAQLFRFQPCG